MNASAQCIGYSDAAWPGITWSFLGYIGGRILIIISLCVCSGPQQTLYVAWINTFAEISLLIRELAPYVSKRSISTFNQTTTSSHTNMTRVPCKAWGSLQRDAVVDREWKESTCDSANVIKSHLEKLMSESFRELRPFIHTYAHSPTCPAFAMRWLCTMLDSLIAPTHRLGSVAAMHTC